MRILPGVPPLLLALTCATHPAVAQGNGAPNAEAAGRAWNGARALELVARAQELRSAAKVDTALVSYQADARGFVYFYLDRADTGERNLVKTDQVALEVLWRAPNLAKQRIVGWRDQKTLPTNIHYHIDHLAVVQDNFGDLIRIGDGDEVRDVLHPAAPGAHTFYEYLLADSLTLRLPGAPEPVRVYELQVRPIDLSEPAFIGSIFVDRRSGALVRMDFTFTPASYRDRHLDYINISLDNGLWLGRFWLPNQQRLELRRQLPELDLPAGTIIRASMRVGNYRFNEPIPVHQFAGAPVVVAPREEREAFPFEEGIFAELRAEGLGPMIELGEIRRHAAALAGRQALSGLPGTRLRLGAASDVLRYNRAEGVVLGAGVSRRMTKATAVSVSGGWAFGPEHPLVSGGIRTGRGTAALELTGRLNHPRETGGEPVISGVINTLTSLLAGRDYSDPFLATGGELRGQAHAPRGWSFGGTARLERHRSLEALTDFAVFGAEPFRPLRPIDDGTMVRGSLELRRTPLIEARRWWSGAATFEIGALEPEDRAVDRLRFSRSRAELGWGWRWEPAALAMSFGVAGGIAGGSLPRQELFLLGGRGTLPGFPFRAFAGDRFFAGSAELAGDLVRPWVRGRVRGGVGWTDVTRVGSAAVEQWGVVPTVLLRGSVAGGFGLFYDLLQVDVARGVGSRGGWELIIDTRRSFWDFL